MLFLDVYNELVEESKMRAIFAKPIYFILTLCVSILLFISVMPIFLFRKIFYKPKFQ